MHWVSRVRVRFRYRVSVSLRIHITDRNLLPARRSAPNPPAAVAAVDRRDRQTEGQTPDRYTDLLCILRAGSVNKQSQHSSSVLTARPLVFENVRSTLYVYFI